MLEHDSRRAVLTRSRVCSLRQTRTCGAASIPRRCGAALIPQVRRCHHPVCLDSPQGLTRRLEAILRQLEDTLPEVAATREVLKQFGWSESDKDRSPVLGDEQFALGRANPSEVVWRAQRRGAAREASSTQRRTGRASAQPRRDAREAEQVARGSFACILRAV